MKNKKQIIGGLIFAILILSIFVFGYTFARYYKKVDTNATANIAKWSFASQNANTTINLSNEKIAPGSSGEFTIEVDSTGSEVNVDYEIKVVNSQNIPRNMKFKAKIVDEKGQILKKTAEYSSFADLATENLNGNISVENGNQKRNVIVSWNWPFNPDDITPIDTEDGTLKLDENGNSSLACLYNIEIIGKQAQQ